MGKNRKLRNELTYPLLIQGDDHFRHFNFVLLEAAKQDFSPKTLALSLQVHSNHQDYSRNVRLAQSALNTGN
jgi:hypothetical protein